MGEPCANPYLYIAAQVAAGLDGIDRRIDPGPPARDPHDVTARPLPRSLSEALGALETGGLARDVLGPPLWQALRMLKRSELRRFQQWATENDRDSTDDSVTEWEHREYFEVY
jgi:glutamine synthetase